jgi:hypothetical protein
MITPGSIAREIEPDTVFVFSAIKETAMLRFSLIALLISSTIACQSTSSVITDIDEEQREALFAPVRGLEGHWVMDSDEYPGEFTFTVSSNGSVVREIMFPGTENEMTNMYSLDGNSLIMTHVAGVHAAVAEFSRSTDTRSRS